jgi:hypothetical protein
MFTTRECVAESYILFESPPGRDPDGAKLREALQAQVALERAESVRVLMVYFVALLSVPNGILSLWRAAPSQLRGLAFAAWAASVAGVILAAVSEWKHHRRRRKVMVALEPPRAPGR